VLATDCGGNRELVQDGHTGRLVSETASATEMAAAWISLLQDRAGAAALGRQARAFVEQHHVPEIALEKFRGLYEQIARG
jgi:glycosyltransferase involved in cell wall biosynthesis